jgi:hypothetical protein
MAGRYYRSRYRSRDEIGQERARQHIEDYHRLVRELGGAVEDVKQYLFSLSPPQLRSIFQDYEAKHGPKKRDYAERTLEKWRTGRRRMSGTVAERLFALLPPRMPLAIKYRLIENLWNHVGPKSKKTLRVGLDANVEQVLEAITSHINDVVVHFKIPDSLERRFNWLAAGDSHVKQDLLNHLRTMEKALVVDGARVRLPVMLEHLRSEAGRNTQRVADVLKIGNHELELLIDKNASGVAIVEPYIALRSATATGQGLKSKWWWWAAAAAVVLYFFAGHQTSKPSYQPSTYSPSSGPITPPIRQPSTYTPSRPSTPPTSQPSTPPTQPTTRTVPLQTDTHLPTPKQSNASPTRQSDGFSDHGPGRVACDMKWSDLHSQGSQNAASSYQDFIRNCMRL